jgi:hypothetical protein
VVCGSAASERTAAIASAAYGARGVLDDRRQRAVVVAGDQQLGYPGDQANGGPQWGSVSSIIAVVA